MKKQKLANLPIRTSAMRRRNRTEPRTLGEAARLLFFLVCFPALIPLLVWKVKLKTYFWPLSSSRTKQVVRPYGLRRVPGTWKAPNSQASGFFSRISLAASSVGSLFGLFSRVSFCRISSVGPLRQCSFNGVSSPSSNVFSPSSLL